MPETKQIIIWKVAYTLWTDKATLSAKMTRPTKWSLWIKYLFNYRFQDQLAMNNYIETRIEELQRKEDQKQIANQKQLDELVPWAILYWSRGYEQTNCDFAKIISRKGKKITIIKLRNQEVWSSGSYMSADVVAGSEIEWTETKHLITPYWIKLNEVCTLQLWDWKPKYSSWYA